MYARVTLLEIDTLRTTVDEALTLYKDRVLPALRSTDGYRGVYVMTTPEGRGLVMSLWETEEAADASADNAFYSGVLAEFMVLFRCPPGRERYEVVFAEDVVAAGPAG
jgi:hypothetical protein